MYSTKFNLSAYAIVRKSNLPCDGEDAGDWVASRVYKLVSGRDYGFKDVIDVVSYEVIPNGYTVGDKTLPPNFEFATVVIDLEVEIVSGSEDTCYDICNTGDIPLPPRLAGNGIFSPAVFRLPPEVSKILLYIIRRNSIAAKYKGSKLSSHWLYSASVRFLASSGVMATP